MNKTGFKSIPYLNFLIYILPLSRLPFQGRSSYPYKASVTNI